MKKSILIGALAVMMLFAFTACEPQTVAWPSSKDVSYLTIEQVKDFIKGDTATDDGFAVIIHYTDDTISDPISGVAKVQDDNKTVKAAITFSGDTTPTNAIDATVAFAPVTGVEITGVDMEADDPVVNAKVVLSYANGSKTFDYDEVVLTYAYKVAGKDVEKDDLADLEAGTEVVVFVTGYKIDTNSAETIDAVQIGSYTVPEEEEQVDTSRVTGMTVLYSVSSKSAENSKLQKVEAVSGLFIGDKVTVQVCKTRVAGDPELITNEGVVVKDDADSKFTALGTAGTVTVEVGEKAYTATVYYYNEQIGKTVSKNVTIPAGNSTVEGTASVEQNMDVALKAGPLSGDISAYVKVTGLSNLDKSEDVKFSIYTDPEMTFSIPESGKETVYYYIEYSSYNGNVKTRNSVDMQAVAEKG